MNRNMRKMYTEEQIVDLIKKNVPSGTKLYRHEMTCSDAQCSLIGITTIKESYKNKEFMSVIHLGNFISLQIETQFGNFVPVLSIDHDDNSGYFVIFVDETKQVTSITFMGQEVIDQDVVTEL